MKLLAIRDFYNVGEYLKIPDATHPKMVHQGAQFEIGGDKPYEELEKRDKDLVFALNVANCITAPTPKNIAAVAVLVEEARKRKASDPGIRPCDPQISYPLQQLPRVAL